MRNSLSDLPTFFFYLSMLFNWYVKVYILPLPKISDVLLRICCWFLDIVDFH